MQNLPGLARAPFNGGLLAVWGSALGDTRVYADGVYIPTLYHFGGLRSTVNAALVSSLTLLPGGYDVEHGRGLGGVVEIETRAPRTDGIHGFAQIDLVDASGLIEGGIGKRFSFGAAFRVSVLEFFLPLRFSPSARASSRNIGTTSSSCTTRPRRATISISSSSAPTTSSHVGLVDTTGGPFHEFDQHTYFHRGLFRWTHRFAGGATLTVTPSVGYDVALQPRRHRRQRHLLQHRRPARLVAARRLSRCRSRALLRFDGGLDYEGTRYTLDARQNPAGLYREGDTGDFLGYTAPNPNESVLDRSHDRLHQPRRALRRA